MKVTTNQLPTVRLGSPKRAEKLADGSIADRWVPEHPSLDPQIQPSYSLGRPPAEEPHLTEASAQMVFSSPESTSRRTLGLSGQACDPAPLTQSHLAFIHRGQSWMEQIAPGFRERLDLLLAPEVDAQLESQLHTTAQQITHLSGLHSHLLSTPESRLDCASRAKKVQIEEQQARLIALYEQLEKKKSACERKQVAQATDLAATFLRRLRQHQPNHQVAAGLFIDPKASQRLASDGLNEQEVIQWFQQFHHQVGLPSPQKPIHFTYNHDRARFFAQTDVLNIGAKFSRRLMLHELAHRLEYRCPEISIANQQWVAARSAQAGFSQTVPLQELVPKGKYGSDEKARPDHFVDPYVGKQYGDMATEVLSVGLEHLADAEGFVRLYRQDSEHLFLTLGSLRAVQSKEMIW